MTDGTDSFDPDGALDELDRRGRAAAAALLAQLDGVVDGDDGSDDPARTVTAAPLPAPPPADAPVDDAPAPQVTSLGRVRGRQGARGTRRRMLAGAAAVAVLVAVGGAVAMVDRDGRPDVTSGGAEGALLPGWLPEGLEPAVAVDFGRAELPGGPSGDAVVYGDPEAADPWAATLTVVDVVIPQEMAGDWQPDEGEPVTVAGREATLSEIDASDSGGRGAGWQVQWPTEHGMVSVGGTDMARETVLAAAAEASDHPAVAAGGLPGGFTELARGPVDAAAPPLGPFYPSAGLALTYRVPAEGDEGRTMIAIVQRRAPASAVDLLRASYEDSEAITVRGQHGVVGRDDDVGVAVQWAEPDGRLVTVMASGLTEQAAREVAERLRPATPGELEALLADHAAPPPGEFDGVPAGQVEVASGDVPGGGRWRVVADSAAGQSMDALTVETVSSDGSSSSGTSSGGSTDGTPPPLELSSDTTGTATVVYGLVTADAATVVLEAPGHQPIPLDLHPVDGWSVQVVASLVPATGGEAVATARATDGREVGRTVVHLGLGETVDPDASGGSGAGSVHTAGSEVCVVAPGGTETCESSSSGGAGTVPGEG